MTDYMDFAEHARRALAEELNARKADRETLERVYGKVWDTEELRKTFEVYTFAAPYVFVKVLETGEKGTLLFQHEPRFYFYYLAHKHQQKEKP